MNSYYKLGHRQAMTSAGLILRWIDKDNVIGPENRQYIKNLFVHKTVEEFDRRRIEDFCEIVLRYVEDATADYYEAEISLKELTQTLRIARAFYDVLNGLELMELE